MVSLENHVLYDPRATFIYLGDARERIILKNFCFLWILLPLLDLVDFTRHFLCGGLEIDDELGKLPVHIRIFVYPILFDEILELPVISLGQQFFKIDFVKLVVPSI